MSGGIEGGGGIGRDDCSLQTRFSISVHDWDYRTNPRVHKHKHPILDPLNFKKIFIEPVVHRLCYRPL